ncbi:MAG: hypothetical protein JNK04_18165, partial [Myxococcales bacterium]|nr:hypothetical protein [Myxococcales bacterium]
FGRHEVRAGTGGLEVAGRVHIPRQSITRMLFTPETETRPSKLLVSGHGTMAQLRVDEPTAKRIMGALSTSDAEPSAMFGAVAPFRSLSSRVFLGSILASIAAFVLVVPLGPSFVHPTIILATIGMIVGSFLLVPSKVHVGIDGVSVETRLDSEFYPRARIRGVTSTARGIRLVTDTGSIDIPLTSRFSLTGLEQDEQRALVAKIESLLASAPAKGRAGAWRLERGSSRIDKWISTLLNARPGYREEEIGSEDLRDVLRSSESGPTRLAAAALLARRGETEDRERIRIAAQESASPKLRVALDKIAEGVDNEEELVALAEAVSEEERAAEG